MFARKTKNRTLLFNASKLHFHVQTLEATYIIMYLVAKEDVDLLFRFGIVTENYIPLM